MASGETHIAGLADLHKLLQELPAKVEGNVMRGALRAGQKVVADEVKSQLDAMGAVDSGALKNSVHVLFRRKSLKRGWVQVNVVAGGSDAWYAHLVEYGTATYYAGKGKTVGRPYVISASDKDGKRFGSREKRRINHGGAAQALFFQGKMVEKVVHPGSRPKPFMRRAVDVAQGPALQAVEAYIRTRLPKEFKKVGSR